MNEDELQRRYTALSEAVKVHVYNDSENDSDVIVSTADAFFQFLNGGSK